MTRPGRILSGPQACIEGRPGAEDSPARCTIGVPQGLYDLNAAIHSSATQLDGRFSTPPPDRSFDTLLRSYSGCVQRRGH